MDIPIYSKGEPKMSTKTELFKDLNPAEIEEVLKAAHLEDRDDYNEIEQALIAECAFYITEGKSAIETAILVELERKNATRSEGNRQQTLELHDLRKIAKDFQSEVNLSETARLLEAIKLAEKEEYQLHEAMKFLKACFDKVEYLKPKRLEDEILREGVERGQDKAEILAKVTKAAFIKSLPEAFLKEFSSGLTEVGKLDEEAILIDLEENWEIYRQRYLKTESSCQNLLPES